MNLARSSYYYQPLGRRRADEVELVEHIEAQKAPMRTHLAELDTLFACLQSRAFSGTLGRASDAGG